MSLAFDFALHTDVSLYILHFKVFKQMISICLMFKQTIFVCLIFIHWHSFIYSYEVKLHFKYTASPLLFATYTFTVLCMNIKPRYLSIELHKLLTLLQWNHGSCKATEWTWIISNDKSRIDSIKPSYLRRTQTVWILTHLKTFIEHSWCSIVVYVSCVHEIK